MKNVLFIVYYFPPMGGSGVQRPLKFVKYVQDFGWNPIVLCPKPGAYHTFDDSLQEELDALDVKVHRVEGNTLFHKGGQEKKEVKISGWLAKVLRWFSAFFFLPDNKKNWIEPGFSKAIELIKDNEVDLIFSSGPPHSNLMLAKQLKEETGLPTVMDLRDDWVESHLVKYPTNWHKQKMMGLEFETLAKADALLTINDRIASSIKSRVFKEVEVIGHGYDPEDFEAHNDISSSSPQKISFLYSGSFYPDSRPDSFLKAVHQLTQKKPELAKKLELQFQGGLNSEHWKLINELGLQNMVLDFGYVDHDLAVKNMQKSDVLWLIVGQRKNPEIISLGKTSEYFATRKPILGLVSEGSARDMLINYGKAFIAEPYEISEIKQQIEQIIKHHKKGDWPDHSEALVKSYNRKNLAGKLANIFNKISAQ